MPWVWWMVWLTWISSCVSRTVPTQRFEDSAALTPAITSVSVADSENFTFAIVGDTHIGNQDTTRLQAILDAAAAENDAFIVFLGDIVESGERSDVLAFRAALTSKGWNSKAFCVIGNHDIFNDGWTHYKELNGPSHYTFTVGNSQFAAIDTADATLGEAEEDWLDAQLKQGTFKNRFLLSHYLPSVPGLRTYLKLSDDQEALHLMKLAVRDQVTAWLGGHYHSYVTGSVNGVSIVVAGGGGGRRMGPVDGFFFVQVIVSGNKVRYERRPIS